MNSLLTIKQQIDTILSITFQFKEFYEKEQWDKLSSALEERQTNLDLLFQQKFSNEDRHAVLEAIQKIQALDADYEIKMTHNRNVVKNELLIFKKQNNAAKSYASISQSS